MTAEPGAAGAGLAAIARAKVNLNLAVVGRRKDGYHLLDSLVVFPEIGDLVEVEPGPGLSLTLDGPQGFALDAGPDNLVLRAALALRRSFGLPQEIGAAIRLEKRLPIAGGVGGGSADAAATLLLLNTLWGLDAPAVRLAEIGLSLGSDLPVCLAAPRTSCMRGIGEDVAPGPELPEFWLALVNPGVEVSTPRVFNALAGRYGPPPEPWPPAIDSVAALVGLLGESRNDLEAAALETAPEIGEALSALRAAPGCALARMSGSGATCWGLFERGDDAIASAARIGSERGAWWTAAGPVRGAGASAALRPG